MTRLLLVLLLFLFWLLGAVARGEAGMIAVYLLGGPLLLFLGALLAVPAARADKAVVAVVYLATLAAATRTAADKPAWDVLDVSHAVGMVPVVTALAVLFLLRARRQRQRAPRQLPVLLTTVPELGPCACCGGTTVAGPGATCPGCGWEESAYQESHPDDVGGPNHWSLREARAHLQAALPPRSDA